tara:strand:- start:76175 stop:76378 length:204 start_codon:yes stop_codon:yes gene_type:complete
MKKEEFDKIMKELDDLLNADKDYSELSKKVKTGNATKDELEVFAMAFDEITWRMKRIDELTNALKSM